MRLAFDVTPLGRARFYPRGRTGIFRVTAELARALGQRPDLSLELTALECRGEAQEELSRLGLNGNALRRSAFDRALFPLVRAAIVPRELPLEVALSDPRRKALRTLVQLLEWVPGGAPRLLRGAVDVWHSPYLPVRWLGLPPSERARAVLTVHDVLPLTHPEFFPNSDSRLLDAVLDDLRNGAWAHCVSAATRTALLKLVPELEARAFVVPLAADESRFYPADAAECELSRGRLELGQTPYMLCLGTLDPRKNVSTLLAAFGRIREQCPDLKLVVAGATARTSASWSQVLSRFAEARPACVFTGFVPEKLLAGLYSGAQAFLFPSLAEGFGLPVLEAMQCGVPVVSSNRTSLPEIVGDAGILLDAEDVEAWSSVIAKLSRSSEWRGALRHQSLERSRAFRWDQSAAQLVQQYQRICAALQVATR